MKDCDLHVEAALSAEARPLQNGHAMTLPRGDKRAARVLRPGASVRREVSYGTSALLALALGATACIGSIGDQGESGGPNAGSSGGEDPHGNPAGYEPAPAALPRLTAAQYHNALRDLLGSSIPVYPVETDTNPYLFFSIGAASTTLSELGTQLYEEAAEQATNLVFADPGKRAALVGCTPATPGDACAAEYLSRFGRRAFRRPLAEDELARWVKVSVDLAQPDAWEGLRLATSGMLQAPSFLYRAELGQPDPLVPGQRRLDAWEMASRLSFLFWESVPDDALLDAAAAGSLDTPEGIAAEAERLLEDTRAQETIQAFFAQYLDLGRLNTVQRTAESYPLFSETMTASMRTEVELLVDGVVSGRGDARSIFSTQTTFVNAELAALYGVDAPGADASTFVQVDLDPEGPRAGMLTLGAFLTMNAHDTQTSPTARGKYVRERVLCQTVPPPPPDVSTDLEPPGEGEAPKTVREQLEEHRTNPACAGCHSFIDPPGFLFEHYDSVGAYRTKLPGDLPVDASGDLDGKPLNDARGLAKELEDDPRVAACMVKQLFRHALGRLDTKGETPALEEIQSRFAEVEYDFRELMVELVTHPSFRTLAEPEAN